MTGDVSMAAYHLIEIPGQRIGKRLIKRLQTGARMPVGLEGMKI